MSRLIWDAPGKRYYETGVDRGVLYVSGFPGVPWNGLTAVTENPSGGSADPYYIDGIKYLNIPAAEEYEATIEAFTYPDEFAVCDGSAQPYNGLFLTAQPRKSFGFSYRSKVGNDLSGADFAYKIHLVYNALAEPSSRNNKTIGDSTDPANFSWKVTTKPPPVTGYKRTSHFVIDSRLADPFTLAAIENILYGDSSHTSRLPDPDELLNIFLTTTSFVVTDNGDGSWTATSANPSEIVDNGDGTFTITSPSAVIVDSETYTLSSP